jgi:hypothetical protein
MAKKDETQSTELEVFRGGEDALVRGADMELTPEIVERRIQVASLKLQYQERIKQMALKATRNIDWVDQDGTPYLQSTGAEKVARIFGLSTEILSVEKVWSEDPKGRFYMFVTTGRVWMGQGDDGIVVVGTCSERDKLFSRGGSVAPDETNIRKKSFTNFFGNAVKRYVGLRNMTWEDLAVAGIKPKTKVTYDKKKDQGGGRGGSRGGSRSSSRSRSGQPSGPPPGGPEPPPPTEEPPGRRSAPAKEQPPKQENGQQGNGTVEMTPEDLALAKETHINLIMLCGGRNKNDLLRDKLKEITGETDLKTLPHDRLVEVADKVKITLEELRAAQSK